MKKNSFASKQYRQSQFRRGSTKKRLITNYNLLKKIKQLKAQRLMCQKGFKITHKKLKTINALYHEMMTESKTNTKKNEQTTDEMMSTRELNLDQEEQPTIASENAKGYCAGNALSKTGLHQTIHNFKLRIDQSQKQNRERSIMKTLHLLYESAKKEVEQEKVNAKDLQSLIINENVNFRDLAGKLGLFKEYEIIKQRKETELNKNLVLAKRNLEELSESYQTQVKENKRNQLKLSNQLQSLLLKNFKLEKERRKEIQTKTKLTNTISIQTDLNARSVQSSEAVLELEKTYEELLEVEEATIAEDSAFYEKFFSGQNRQIESLNKELKILKAEVLQLKSSRDEKAEFYWQNMKAKKSSKKKCEKIELNCYELEYTLSRLCLENNELRHHINAREDSLKSCGVNIDEYLKLEEKCQIEFNSNPQSKQIDNISSIGEKSNITPSCQSSGLKNDLQDVEKTSQKSNALHNESLVFSDTNPAFDSQFLENSNPGKDIQIPFLCYRLPTMYCPATFDESLLKLSSSEDEEILSGSSLQSSSSSSSYSKEASNLEKAFNILPTPRGFSTPNKKSFSCAIEENH